MLTNYTKELGETMENKSLIPTKEEFDILQAISKTATDSKYFDKLGGLPGILSIALYAREIDVGPMVALMGGFSNVQGKITMSAELMNTLIRRKGHKLQTLKCTNEICEITGERGDTKEKMTVSFTIKEAEAAGLVKGGGAWSKYTSDMLFARCISRLRRRLFPDVATRSYVEGEIEEVEVELESTQAESAPIREEQTITPEQALEIEKEIGEDDDYRTRLLQFWSTSLKQTVTKFDQIPAKKLSAIWNSLNRREKPKKDEIELAEVM